MGNVQYKICGHCKEGKEVTSFSKVYNCDYMTWCKECRREYNRQYSRRLKQDCIFAYGNECECCKETCMEFLTLDHTKHIGEFNHDTHKGTGSRFYQWLKKNKYPTNLGLRVLCMNCNFSHGQYGYCPHKECRTWE